MRCLDGSGSLLASVGIVKAERQRLQTDRLTDKKTAGEAGDKSKGIAMD